MIAHALVARENGALQRSLSSITFMRRTLYNRNIRYAFSAHLYALARIR